MEPKVNIEKCIGCGACEATAPNTFKIDESGKSTVINPSGDSEELIKQAQDACPVQAITIE